MSPITLLDTVPEPESLHQVFAFLLKQLQSKNELVAQFRADISVLSEARNSLEAFAKEEKKSTEALQVQLSNKDKEVSSLLRKVSPKATRKGDLQRVLSALEVQSPREALQLISKLQQVAQTLPNVNKFIELLCTETLGSASHSPELLIAHIQQLKSDSRLVPHLKKLFRVEKISEIEQIYWFVHEMKKFLSNARKKLATPDSVPIHQLLRHIYNSL